MLNHTGKLGWFTVVVFLLGILLISGSASSAALPANLNVLALSANDAVLLPFAVAGAEASDSGDSLVVQENKISIIPESTTLIVLLAGLLLFTWKRKYKDKFRSVAPRC